MSKIVYTKNSFYLGPIVKWHYVPMVIGKVGVTMKLSESGPIVKWYYASMAWMRSGFDSP